MTILKPQHMLPLGMISLALALLVDRFLPQESIFDFIVGILIGLSIALNLAGLYYGSRYMKTL